MLEGFPLHDLDALLSICIQPLAVLLICVVGIMQVS